MKFSILREVLLPALLQVVAVVANRHQGLPVLNNVALSLTADTLRMTGTDLEQQISATVEVNGKCNGQITIPARKLSEIVKALPEGSTVAFSLKDSTMTVTSGRSRFRLASLPFDEYPTVEIDSSASSATIPAEILLEGLSRTAFAMGNKDVRFYLNGLLFELGKKQLRLVATDGHRLAHHDMEMESETTISVIIPRDGVNTLKSLTARPEGDVAIALSDNHAQFQVNGYELVTKLIDGKFPEYKRVMPTGSNESTEVKLGEFRSAIHRALIISDEKHRGVKLQFSAGKIVIDANNPDQENAREVVDAQGFAGDNLTIGFNGVYISDALAALPFEEVVIETRGTESSTIIRGKGDTATTIVVMPMRY